jgi:hypothetical protein
VRVGEEGWMGGRPVRVGRGWEEEQEEQWDKNRTSVIIYVATAGRHDATGT